MATENETEKTEQPMSSRDVVAAAFDAYEEAGPDAGLISLEKPGEEKPDEPADAEGADKAGLGGGEERAVEVEEPASQRERDPKTGQFKKGDVKAKPPVIRAKGGPAETPATPREQSAAVPPPAAAAPASERDRTLRAPQSWRPGAREGFEKLPSSVRQEIWRLDQEREKVVRESAGHRKSVEDWQRVIAPYEASIRASGVEPQQAVGNVMRTVYALGTQPEPARARIIHGLMKMYGVSVDSLASAIDEGGGAGNTQPAPQAGPQPVYDPRFDTFYAQWYQDRQATEQRQAQAADAELEDFARDHEFLDDVLPEMVDFMDVAAKRGLAMDYETAYSRSLALRPDLLEILQQREAASESDGPTRRALEASSSVRSSPSRRPAPGQKFKDSREAAAAAYDQHSGEGGRV